MRFKLLVTVTDDAKTGAVLDAARAAGGTGATILANARGEGLKQTKGVFGLEIFSQRDVLLFLVEEHLARQILEAIAEAGEFDTTPGTGIVIQIDVEDALGVAHQIETLAREVGDRL
jgi:hypothetical protein